MEIPEPTSHHRQLFRIAGDWGGDEELLVWPDEGAVSRQTGRTRARVALEGLAVLADYEQVRDGQVVFRGHGLFTYDSEAAEYLLHWFDCAGGRLETFRGDFLGEVLTVSYSGPALHVRLTCDFAEPGHLRSRLETSTDGVNWRAVFRGTYMRRN